MSMQEIPWKIFIGPLLNPEQLGAYLTHPQIQAFADPKALVPLSPQNPWFSVVQSFPLNSSAIPYQPQWSVQDWLGSCGDWQPELLIWWGFGHQILPKNIESAPCKTLLIVSDWQGQLGALRDLAGAFDWIFADRQLESLLNNWGYQNVCYWPAYGFFPGRFQRTNNGSRPIDLAYAGNLSRGTHPQRLSYLAELAQLEQKYQVEITNQAFGEAYVQLLNQSKLVFNYALRGEMNLRAYEACACGALLLIEEDNLEVRDFLVPGQSCVTYTPENLCAQVEYYLFHDQARREIANAGYQAIQAWSYTHQFESLLKELPGIMALPKLPRPFLGLKPNHRLAVSAKQARQTPLMLSSGQDYPIRTNQSAWRLYSEGQFLAAFKICQDFLLTPPAESWPMVYLAALFPAPQTGLQEWHLAWEQTWQSAKDRTLYTPEQMALLKWNFSWLMGQILIQAQDWRGALSGLEIAFQIDPQLENLSLICADLAQKQGNLTQAIFYLETYQQGHPFGFEALLALLTLYVARGYPPATGLCADGQTLRLYAQRIAPWQKDLARLENCLRVLGI